MKYIAQEIGIVGKSAARQIFFYKNSLFFCDTSFFFLFFQVRYLDEKRDILFIHKRMKFFEKIRGQAGPHPKYQDKTGCFGFFCPKGRKFFRIIGLYDVQCIRGGRKYICRTSQSGGGRFHICYAENRFHECYKSFPKIICRRRQLLVCLIQLLSWQGRRKKYIYQEPVSTIRF